MRHFLKVTDKVYFELLDWNLLSPIASNYCPTSRTLHKLPIYGIADTEPRLCVRVLLRHGDLISRINAKLEEMGKLDES